MSTLANVAPGRGQTVPHSIGFISDVPLTESQSEVSVRYAPDPTKKWYVMRATYHREKRHMITLLLKV